MATTTAPHVPPTRIVFRTREEMIRIRRLKRNLANSHPDVSRYALNARCPDPEFEVPTPIEKLKRDNISLGKNLGMTLFHREYLIKQLGVFGMVANSEERHRLYKNWVRSTKDGLQKDEESVSEEYRRLKLHFMVDKNRVRGRICIRVKDRPTLEKKLSEIQDKEEEAAAAYVKECKKLHAHRVKMENEMKRIQGLLAEMSQYPQGDLPKIWGKGYDQAFKNIGRRTNPEESGEISDLV
ncbi:uncharacterized protein Bfra_004852 [Botrytis fragariae]|uniref:Uncharacterized protein n=1 Tax=Botrytis fragariae TaxID=1964551 RepID=A0A8H6EIE3_9HELO|nr:uncharacterized protein Bfra_004852 [Botrytis fragariae]KAF5873392.1 hypothetical protein Bfra_004852 [Botrytis fragariae]